MSQKVLLTLYDNEIASRFDLATEVLVVLVGEDGLVAEEKNIVLPHASAEDLCQLILTEETSVVICGGIEEEFFEYLTWKKVQVMDSVMGPWKRALECFRAGQLKTGTILYDRPERKTHVE